MIGEIISWLVFGLIVGALARLLLPGRDPMGCFMTALLGIAGSIIGGLVSYLIWGSRYGTDYYKPRPGWILSILGAMLLLFIYRSMRRP